MNVCTNCMMICVKKAKSIVNSVFARHLSTLQQDQVKLLSATCYILKRLTPPLLNITSPHLFTVFIWTFLKTIEGWDVQLVIVQRSSTNITSNETQINEQLCIHRLVHKFSSLTSYSSKRPFGWQKSIISKFFMQCKYCTLHTMYDTLFKHQ